MDINSNFHFAGSEKPSVILQQQETMDGTNQITINSMHSQLGSFIPSSPSKYRSRPRYCEIKKQMSSMLPHQL